MKKYVDHKNIKKYPKNTILKGKHVRLSDG